MTHDEARLLIGATPGQVSEPLAEHLAHCPECTVFQQQMQRMDLDLARLFATPLPVRPDTRILPLPIGRQPRITRAQRSPGLMALAASVLLCVGLGSLLWTLRPSASLAAGVIGHVENERASWSAVAPMTAAATDPILAKAGVSLDPTDVTITYARTCLFDGHWVPHLVVRTAQGPVTVLILRDESIAARQSFKQNGYSGVLIPEAKGGTLALIAPGQKDMGAVAQVVDTHLHWNR